MWVVVLVFEVLWRPEKHDEMEMLMLMVTWLECLFLFVSFFVFPLSFPPVSKLFPRFFFFFLLPVTF